MPSPLWAVVIAKHGCKDIIPEHALKSNNHPPSMSVLAGLTSRFLSDDMAVTQNKPPPVVEPNAENILQDPTGQPWGKQQAKHAPHSLAFSIL